MMLKCRECGSDQYEGALFCEECGCNLLIVSGQTTAVLPFSDKLVPRLPRMMTKEELAASDVKYNVTFVIPSSGRRVFLQASKEIRVGRADPAQEVKPELDLTPDGGGMQGVSRLHAIIQLTPNGAALIDLGSTNGTLLNAYQIPAQMPYLLNSGDEVRFGHLLVHVFFEKL